MAQWDAKGRLQVAFPLFLPLPADLQSGLQLTWLLLLALPSLEYFHLIHIGDGREGRGRRDK